MELAKRPLWAPLGIRESKVSVNFMSLSNIGVEVTGLDLARLSDAATRKTLYEAWLEHGVLLFRGLGTSPDIHRDLSRCFGPLEEQDEIFPALRVEGETALINITRPEMSMGPSYYIDGRLLSGVTFWHQDTMFDTTVCKGGMLRMIEPAKVGGETAWVDTVKVYESLPESMRSKLDSLEVRHRFRVDLTGIPFGLPASTREASQEEAPFERAPMPSPPDVIHPLVSTHPETGKKSLSISPQTLVQVIGMEKAQSDKLLSELVDYSLRDDYKMTHRWGVNDMVVWDNRRTMHAGLGFPPDQRRFAQRTTLAGGIRSGRIYEEAA